MDMTTIKCIGILTSGGDAPGMNAAVRAVTRCAIYNDIEVKGIYRGYKGLITGEIEQFKTQNVSNIIQRGGTILKTARCQEFRTPEGRKQAYDKLKEEGIDALVVIGGDGTLTGARIFAQEFNYKHWNVSVLFEGVARVNYMVGGTGYIPFINKETGNILTIVGDQRNRWTSRDISGDPSTENPNAKFPRLSYGANNNNDQSSTFWLRDGSYLRLKYIQISYLLKKPWMQAIGMNSATISLIGDNLWIWDKGDKIFDPAQASGNGATYPLQRVFSLQVNVSF